MEKETTSGHELYLRYILLLVKVASLALKGFLNRKFRESKENISDLIIEKKNTFKNSYREEFQVLFGEGFDITNIDSWSTRLLCVVVLVLFHTESDKQCAEFEAVQCILKQTKDLDNYVKSASLDYKTYETKRNALHVAVIELIEDVDEKHKFDCKQMIHSYKKEPINISLELETNLKQTSDVKMHVEIALKSLAATEHGNQVILYKRETEKNQSGNSKFTETLQDKVVYSNDPAVFTCKLTTSAEQVTWRHNGKQIEESETLKTVKSGDCRWLVISPVKLKDAGFYSCDSCSESTRANLTVLDEPSLVVSEELHVATEEDNIRENMDIVLVCKINKCRAVNATWRHNENEIKCKRHLVSLNGNIHTLQILKAQYKDEGEYTVAFGTTKSSTNVTLKGSLNLAHRIQLTNDLYKNWIRGALGLKYLKLGLEDVTRSIVMKHHSELLDQLSSIGITCTQCTTEDLLPAHSQKNCRKKSKCICSKQRHKRKYCPNGGFCSQFFDKVLNDHRLNEPELANTDIQKWANDPWSVATCYIKTHGYHNKSSEKEIDCAGILSMCINNTCFERSLKIEVNGETDVFTKGRDNRKDILYNANYELSNGLLNQYLDQFINVLEVKDVNGEHALSSYNGTNKAIDNLNELKRNEIDISIAGDFKKQKQKLEEHAMIELAKEADKATQQNNLKLQHLEERLTVNEREFQLMRDLRTSQSKIKTKAEAQAVFKLDLHLEVIEQTGQTSSHGNERIFHSMKEYHSGSETKTSQCTSRTDASVQRLLDHIKVLENCKIADISTSRTAVVITIHCFTYKAVEIFLKLIKGNELQKETMELRKCLEENENLKIYDVVASCSSESLENTRKSLCNKTHIQDITCKNHLLECTWYCSDHDTFICPTCKDEDHGICIGLEQVISYREQKQSLILKREIGKYKVKIKSSLINRNKDEIDNDITSMRMLPNGEILLVDRENARLKKLDGKYKVVSHCDIPYHPIDVCWVGNDRAAVSLGERGIQFVNVSGNMKLEQQVELGHKCVSMSCHGEILYVGNGQTIYRYNKTCEHKHVLYNYPGHNGNQLLYHIAVSDDGKRIYTADDNHYMLTIDDEGNPLSTLKMMANPMDICVVGDGTVLVAFPLEYQTHVRQVDYKGENVLGTVKRSTSDLLYEMMSMCFDRLRCRLLVTRRYNNYINVYKLKMHSNC